MSKFVEGMRVAKVSGFSGHSHTEAFVEKVYKNGNFTLKGDADKQQWKPYRSGEYAQRTGETSRYATTVEIWDALFDEELAKKEVRKAKDIRANVVSDALRTILQNNQVRHMSDELLTELEAIVEKCK